MRSQPYITVTCDECHESVEIALTETGRGWDSRHVNGELEDRGWLVIDGADLCCDDCSISYVVAQSYKDRGSGQK